MKSASGFTIIELLIVVAIIGVLAAVAVPMYAEQVTRTQLVEGHTGLSDMRVRMEQFFQDNRTYTGAGLGGCGAAAPVNSTNFRYSCQSTGLTYVATATGSAGRVQGFAFTVNESNLRRTTAAPAGWAPSPPRDCWVTRKSAC